MVLIGHVHCFASGTFSIGRKFLFF